jgi:hypothetical protein
MATPSARKGRDKDSVPTPKNSAISPERCKIDLGDRYRNSLSYLTQTRTRFAPQLGLQDTLKDTAIDVEQLYDTRTSRFSFQPEGLPADSNLKNSAQNFDSDPIIDREVEAMVRSLHSAIDADFRRKAGCFDEQLYHLPDDYVKYTLIDKLRLARDLAEQIYQGILNNSMMFSPRRTTPKLFLDTQNIPEPNNARQEAGVNLMKVKGEKNLDVLSRIFQLPSNGIMLSEPDTKELAGLLLGAVRDSASHELKVKLHTLQDKYEAVSEKLSKLRGQLKKREEEQEHLINNNTQLRNSVKVLKQQIGSLEKQLEDTIVENYLNEEKCKKTREELMEARSLIQQFMQSENSAQLNLQLEPSKLKNNRVSRESGVSPNIRFIYNSSESIMKKSVPDTEGEEFYIVKCNPKDLPHTPQFGTSKVPIHNAEELEEGE